VNRAWRVETPVASVAIVVAIGPSVVVPAEFGTTLRSTLPQRLLSVSWVTVAIGHHYPTHQNHWGYFVSV
jgi:hypothetical protein